MRSTDGGKAWELLAPLVKHSYMDGFESFRMDPRGHGTLTIRHDCDYSKTGSWWSRWLPRRTEEPLPPGIFLYSTRNGGRTWSEPTFQEDDLEPLEALPEN